MSDKDTTVPAEDAKQPAIEEQQSTTPQPPENLPTEEGKEPVPGTEEQKKESTPQERKPRTVHMMPVDKAQEEKRKAVEKAREEMKAELDNLRQEYEGKINSPANNQDYTSKIEEFSQKYGLEVEAAKDLIGIIHQSLPDMSKYDQLMKNSELENQKIQAASEFDQVVAPLIRQDNPGVTQAQLDEAKQKILDLAFTQEYSSYPLQDIYTVKRGDLQVGHGYTAEPGGAGRAAEPDFAKMSEEELLALPPDKYREATDMLARGQSLYTT